MYTEKDIKDIYYLECDTYGLDKVYDFYLTLPRLTPFEEMAEIQKKFPSLHSNVQVR